MTHKGMVFDIQRFSIHDGPGIRTLVFLKGCYLKCPWCCNPESQSFEPQLLFQPDKCIGCGSCLQICPHGAILSEDGRMSFDRALCQGCGQCAQVCYAEARVMKGRLMSVDQVVEQALKDWAFYANSGGGITLGGGEPVAQAEFAGAILKKCKQKGLHTAVETSGHVPWQKLEGLLPYTDLFLYDLKHMDPGKHREMTGADNTLILANLEEIVWRKGEVVVRVPVIPGFNDTEGQIVAIARHAAKLGVREMHLLPYHRFGVHKYALLGRDYPLKGLKALKDEQTEALRRAASFPGLEVRLHG